MAGDSYKYAGTLVRSVAPLQVVSDFTPSGDQPTAIAELVSGLEGREHDQVLLGVTGSGKTFTMANVIAQRPDNRDRDLLDPHSDVGALAEALGLTVEDQLRANRWAAIDAAQNANSAEHYVPTGRPSGATVTVNGPGMRPSSTWPDVESNPGTGTRVVQ